MRYSLGDTLADYGFSFFEKLHHPLFLVHRNGRLKKVNAAGRKLIKVAHLTSQQLSDVVSSMGILEPDADQVIYKSFSSARANLKVIATKMAASDYVLIELLHTI